MMFLLAERWVCVFSKTFKTAFYHFIETQLNNVDCYIVTTEQTYGGLL